LAGAFWLISPLLRPTPPPYHRRPGCKA